MELLAPRLIPKLEDDPLSAVRDCLFNIFVATLHIGGHSSIRNLRTRHAVVTGKHLSRWNSLYKYKINIIYLSSVLTILGSFFRLTPGCHGCSPTLFFTYVIFICTLWSNPYRVFLYCAMALLKAHEIVAGYLPITPSTLQCSILPIHTVKALCNYTQVSFKLTSGNC